MRRTSVRLIAPPPRFGIVARRKLRADRGFRSRSARSGAAIPSPRASAGAQPHCHGAAGFRTGDETRIVKHVEMLHHGRQLDRRRLREFADGRAALAFELSEDHARRVGSTQHRERTIQSLRPDCQPLIEHPSAQTARLSASVVRVLLPLNVLEVTFLIVQGGRRATSATRCRLSPYRIGGYIILT